VTLIVSCGSVVDEAKLGCTVHLYILPGHPSPRQPPAITAVNSTAVSIALEYNNGDAAHIVLGAVDAVGNVGHNISLQWRLDTTVGGWVTGWLSALVGNCALKLFVGRLMQPLQRLTVPCWRDVVMVLCFVVSLHVPTGPPGSQQSPTPAASWSHFRAPRWTLGAGTKRSGSG
jgi:hypothetical protein